MLTNTSVALLEPSTTSTTISESTASPPAPTEALTSSLCLEILFFRSCFAFSSAPLTARPCGHLPVVDPSARASFPGDGSRQMGARLTTGISPTAL